MGSKSDAMSFGVHHYNHKPLFVRAILTYANRGQLLSGHYKNKIYCMLQSYPVPVHLTLPIFLEIYAVRGHRLDKMILNAARFMLLIHRENQELPGHSKFGWFMKVQCGNQQRLYRPGMPIAPPKYFCEHFTNQFSTYTFEKFKISPLVNTSESGKLGM